MKGGDQTLEGRVNEQESNDAWAAEAERLKLRPDLTLLPLDDQVVVFSEEAQCLIGLNASAALVVRRMQAGTPDSTIEHDLVAEGIASPEEAAAWMTTVLDAIGSHGLLRNGVAAIPRSAEIWDEEKYLARMASEMPAYAPVTPVAEQRYRLLDTCALIRFAHLAQVRLVNAVIGHLATDSDRVPTVTLEIQATRLKDENLRGDLYRNGVPVGYATRLSSLGPVVKSTFWSSAVNAYDFLFYIHAGVVGTGDTCVLLPAAPGSGKSSLTAALTHRGFRYFSDEVALIKPGTFQVPPMPLAFCIKSTGWELMYRYYPEIASVPVHNRDDGKRVRYVPPPPGAIQQKSATVSHIIFPRYEEGGPTELKPIARSEALGRLMSECLALRRRLDQNNVREIVRWIAGIDCYTLTFSSLDEAAELVAQVTAHETI